MIALSREDSLKKKKCLHKEKHGGYGNEKIDLKNRSRGWFSLTATDACKRHRIQTLLADSIKEAKLELKGFDVLFVAKSYRNGYSLLNVLLFPELLRKMSIKRWFMFTIAFAHILMGKFTTNASNASILYVMERTRRLLR